LDPIIIIGSGLAGYGVARELRKLAPGTEMTMLTSDEGAFYSKPKLSTALAYGKHAAELVGNSAEAMAAQLAMTVLPHVRVRSIDPKGHVVRTNTGEFRYSKLILALGADPVRVEVEGNAGDSLITVNNLTEYGVFRERLADARNVLIVGGGLIGSEFANDLCAAGIAVTVVETTGWPLSALVPQSIGDAAAEALAAAGTTWRFGRKVVAVDHAGESFAIRLDDGEILAADLVMSAVGLRPHTALAAGAGLSVGRGIVVDSTGATSHPDIFALGDCAQYPSGNHCYVTPIMTAARTIARSALAIPAEMAFPALSVLVKTTLYPIVLAPPNGVEGAWATAEGGAEGLTVRFHAVDGRIAGYALSGDRVALRGDFDREIVAARSDPESGLPSPK
jgi:rubredoxin-NAD+ reductase